LQFLTALQAKIVLKFQSNPKPAAS